MGQVLRHLHDLEYDLIEVGHNLPRRKSREVAHFTDLTQLPPEIGLLVLSHLNATDLCLAGCVWKELASDELLWQGLCIKQFGPLNVCTTSVVPDAGSFRQLYMLLDEGTLTFNADPKMGFEYLMNRNLLTEDVDEIAKFLHYGRDIDAQASREFLADRSNVLDQLVRLQNFKDQFLPNALRQFFNQTHPPNERGGYLHELIDKFSSRFCDCNPNIGLRKDTIYVVCFSLILLSVDLTSPHIKNKMSKREFIKNTRRAADDVNEDFAGHLYDNVYLVGHVAPNKK